MHPLWDICIFITESRNRNKMAISNTNSIGVALTHICQFRNPWTENDFCLNDRSNRFDKLLVVPRVRANYKRPNKALLLGFPFSGGV